MVPDGNVDPVQGNDELKKWPVSMKIHSVSLVIQEMQIKTILRCYFLPIKMAIIKEKNVTSVGKTCKLEHLYTAEGMLDGTTALENSLAVLQKLNTELIYDTAFPLLCTYTEEK